jgi:hypothetical protein
MTLWLFHKLAATMGRDERNLCKQVWRRRDEQTGGDDGDGGDDREEPTAAHYERDGAGQRA